MSTNSKIEWCHHTFNPWRGCTKVSAGCANCYAEKLSHRNPKTLGVWGDNGTRVGAAESYWKLPPAWDKAAAKAGEQHRVFCASLADVFEDRPELVPWRRRLLDLVCRTPNLDWLLLTKRPENALRMMVEAGLYATENPHLPCPQPNLWIGTSTEDQKVADERIPHLLHCPAAVRFLSVEPMLGAIDLLQVKSGMLCPDPEHRIDVLRGGTWNLGGGFTSHSDMPGTIDWVIVGGESGPGARPMHPDWARSIRDQCEAAGVAFFFKQWGEFAPLDAVFNADVIPHDQIPRSTPVNSGIIDGEPKSVFRVGKKATGRLLEGREWSEFPYTFAPAGGAEGKA